MKKLPIAGIVALIVFLLITLRAVSADWVLSWDASMPTNVTYKVWLSTNGTLWQLNRSTPALTVTISNVPANTTHAAISAFTTNSESAKTVIEKVFAPTNVRLVEQ